MNRTKDGKRYEIDFDRKVFVYKNLHKDCWSIKQDGLVKAHAEDLTIYSGSMKVNRKGRERVLREKRKNVHAGISGYISHPDPSFGCWDDIKDEELTQITYNPYKHKSFVDKATQKPRWFCSVAKLNKKSVFVEKNA